MYIRNVVEFEVELPDEKKHTEAVQWTEKYGYLNDNWNTFLFCDKALKKWCIPEIEKIIDAYENVDYWLIHFWFAEE